MVGILTKKALKEADNAAYLARVQTALAAAKRAAKEAADLFIKDAPKTPEGFVRDTCGTASVVIFNPSYRLRQALKNLGEITPGHRGAWQVSHFATNVHSQSFLAHEKACSAACYVLHRYFPDEQQFFVTTYDL